MKIRRVQLRKDDLLKMAEAERAFVLLAGHMLNELNSLNKVFVCCLHNSSRNRTSTKESLANGAQAMIYARILAGKLWEAREALQKAFFGTGLSKRVEPKGYSCLEMNGREEDIFPVHSLNEVTIPFFFKPDVDQ